MAVLKCKMCGGALEANEGETIAVCEYCGTRQTIPNRDDEKKLALFARAERLRRSNEFNKAAGVYESIVSEFPEEAEAYWGLVLCKYGIEYVDDPATGNKIPTCHRSSFDSVLDDVDFEQACENADPVAKRLYREEAKAIEDLRRGILEISGQEVPYDIFICYKETDDAGNRTVDSVMAQDVYDALTEKGYRVFFSRISLEDKLGAQYEPYIFAALNSAKIMLVFGTDYDYFDAVWVKNEWQRFLSLIASGQKKVLIPCYKGVDAYDLPKEFAHLQAQDMGKVGAVQDLLRGVDKILAPEKKEAAPTAAAAAPATAPATAGAESLIRRGQLFLEDEAWKNAAEYFDKALDIDPENGHAYIGKFCVKMRYRALKDMTKDALSLWKEESPKDDANFAKALRFADAELKSTLEKELEKINAVLKKKAESDKEKARVDAEHRRQAIPRLKEIREKWKPAAGIVVPGSDYTVGLRLDGTVVAVGGNQYGRCNVYEWKDIVTVASRNGRTVGLRSNGTVVAVGINGNGQCNVSGWRDIVAIAVEDYHTVGLKSDGTVVSTTIDNDSYDNKGQCNVSGWTDIVSVAAGYHHTVGLKADGTVVAVGENPDKIRKVSGWRNIVAVATGWGNVFGLKSDGTVVAAGNNYCDECEVSDWRDIVAIAAGSSHTVGLKVDGTVVAAGENEYGQCDVSGWTDIVAIATRFNHTIGLKSDGTVVAAGKNDKGQNNTASWKLFGSIDTLEQERAEVKRKKQEELKAERDSLQAELSQLKGLFSGRRRREIESRLAAIERQLHGNSVDL